MHIPWKKIFGGIEKGIAVAAPFEPHIAMIQGAIYAVEAAVPGPGAGADKKAVVKAVALALIQSDLAGLTADQVASLSADIDAYIDLYVSAQNLAAQEEAARAHLRESIAALKAKQAVAA